MGILKGKLEDRKTFLAACGDNVSFLEEARRAKLAEMKGLLHMLQIHQQQLLGMSF